MKPNVVFNMTVCIVGIAILLIRLVNMIIKKNRRKDESRLLTFLFYGSALRYLFGFNYTLPLVAILLQNRFAGYCSV